MNPGGRFVHRREADISAKVGVSEFLEKLRPSTFGDAGSAVDDEVLVQDHGVTIGP